MKDSDFDNPLTYRQIYGEPDASPGGLVVVIMIVVGLLIWAFR